MPHPRMYADDDPQLGGVRRVCLALPEAVEVEAWGWPSFRAGAKGKMFAIYDHHSDDGYALTFKADPADRAALLEDKRFFEPWYWGTWWCPRSTWRRRNPTGPRSPSSSRPRTGRWRSSGS